MTTAPSRLKRLASGWLRLEEILLVSLLLLMVLLGFLQIFFRNVISVGLIWIDPLQRHMVLWVALLGASVATRENRHITIDLLQGRLGEKSLARIRAAIHFFSAFICFLLIHPALRFIQEEYQVGKTLALGIPIWVSQSILPVMLTVIGLRFLARGWTLLISRTKD
jgi:TRAP-type C4-dicarboxylate transport system permease small subunit